MLAATDESSAIAAVRLIERMLAAEQEPLAESARMVLARAADAVPVLEAILGTDVKLAPATLKTTRRTLLLAYERAGMKDKARALREEK